MTPSAATFAVCLAAELLPAPIATRVIDRITNIIEPAAERQSLKRIRATRESNPVHTVMEDATRKPRKPRWSAPGAPKLKDYDFSSAPERIIRSRMKRG